MTSCLLLWNLLLKDRVCFYMSKFFPFEVDSIETECTNENIKVVLLGSLLIHLICVQNLLEEC